VEIQLFLGKWRIVSLENMIVPSTSPLHLSDFAFCSVSNRALAPLYELVAALVECEYPLHFLTESLSAIDWLCIH
jgi:hypothetical protein